MIEETLKEILNLPCIGSEDVIERRGCFNVYPVSTNGLVGDGSFQTANDSYAVNVFGSDRQSVMDHIKLLMKSKMIVAPATYTFEKDWKVWRAQAIIYTLGGK